MIIGVTGGIGSGKSVVASRLGKLLSAIVVSADDICRELLEPDGRGFTLFVRSGGERFLNKDGTLDRRALRKELFSNRTLKKQLESILHPLVFEKIRETAESNPQSTIIAEVPLLFESGRQHLFDVVISVFAPEEQLVDRVAARDHVGREAVLEILATQMPPEEKNSRADYIIDNQSDLRKTEEQLTALADTLQRRIAGCK